MMPEVEQIEQVRRAETAPGTAHLVGELEDGVHCCRLAGCEEGARRCACYQGAP